MRAQSQVGILIISDSGSSGVYEDKSGPIIRQIITEQLQAIIAQVAEVSGTINGDLAFFGQMLEVKPGAVITGDLIIHGAQQTSVPSGAVQGSIKNEGPQAIPQEDIIEPDTATTAPELPEP